MAGKFIYHFGDGSTMRDRNRYKTIAGAKSWAKAHNMSKKNMAQGRKVIRITKVKK